MKVKKKNLTAWTCRLAAIFGAAFFTVSFAGTAFANCPALNGIGNVQQTSVVSASVSTDGTTDTYFLTTTNQSAVDGVPGVISYCIYPSQPPANPTSAAVGPGITAFTNDGSSFQTQFKAAQGYFAFTRDTGNPSNIPLNAANTTASPITMGTATWPTGTAPDSNHQTIVL